MSGVESMLGKVWELESVLRQCEETLAFYAAVNPVWCPPEKAKATLAHVREALGSPPPT